MKLLFLTPPPPFYWLKPILIPTELAKTKKVKKVASLIFDITSDVSASGNHTNPVGMFDLVKGVNVTYFYRFKGLCFE